jgi:hypothetical protein
MKSIRSNYVSFTLVTIALAGILAGCMVQQPAISDIDNQRTKSSDPEDAMFSLVSEQAVYHVLRNVDRPFETEVEKPIIYVPDDECTIANVVVYCALKKNNRTEKRLFFVMFENTQAPSFAANKEDLSCLLVNADGKVLYRDDDYWNRLPEDVQEKSGAIDGNGPPFIATTMIKLKHS